MRKTIALLIAATLLLCMAPGALAAPPAEGSLKAEVQTIRGNASWTPESYPEIWITPIFAEYIIEAKDPEKYPPKFLRFAPPEGSSPLEFQSDYATFADFDTLAQYSYQVMDRASFELFLEKAEEGITLADGGDGVAIYVLPDNRRGRAMIDLKAQFGGTAKLTIEIYDHTGDLSGEELGKQITAEVERVKGSMALEELEGYWSKGVYASIALYDDYDDINIPIDTTGMTITRAGEGRIYSQEVVDGKACETQITLGGLMWEDEVKDAALADGTPYKVRNSEYSSYAFFPIKEGKLGDEYLNIQMDTDAASFAEKLEKVYSRITMPKAE